MNIWRERFFKKCLFGKDSLLSKVLYLYIHSVNYSNILKCIDSLSIIIFQDLK